MILVDVSAWLALVHQAQPRHGAVLTWKRQVDDDLTLCRVTQMALLRLLTMPAVMGEDVLTRSEAWRILDQLRSDPGVAWSPEPVGLEPLWRSVSDRDERSHRLWTDDYLAAFAMAAGARLATLDRQFGARYPALEVITLG